MLYLKGDIFQTPNPVTNKQENKSGNHISFDAIWTPKHAGNLDLMNWK